MNPSPARRALGPGAARALGPQPRPHSRQQPPWARPAAVPAPPARPDPPQPAQRPAEQAAEAIAALRHVRTPPPPPPRTAARSAAAVTAGRPIPHTACLTVRRLAG
ncbi:hypothetical protein ACWGKU_28735 [Kitasatospora sp. NPDC054768]